MPQSNQGDSRHRGASASAFGPWPFRKKPVVIEAMLYTRGSRDAVIEWCGATHTAIDDDGAEYELENLRIETLEGEHQVSLGDWIIKGVAGEFYPCKPEIFAQTYEAEGDVS